ncbi:hypothetical protein DPMN_148386 [Dreissena polymorpha]|uniref:Uncharacterized protein n=1 Tax=Dreissena polymorpha TaxID=45954 RepID=A0A9D4FCE1_DREPO|nr:hypothetical protein DPMN_148386 [Dreissena polymorpha]
MASVGVQCQTTNLCMSVGVQCQLLFLEQVIIRTSTPRKATPTTYSIPMDTSFQSVFQPVMRMMLLLTLTSTKTRRAAQKQITEKYQSNSHTKCYSPYNVKFKKAVSNS